VENRILRPVYKKYVPIFCPMGCAFIAKVFKRYQSDPKKIFWKKSKLVSKDAEVYDEYKTVGKNAKLITKKV